MSLRKILTGTVVLTLSATLLLAGCGTSSPAPSTQKDIVKVWTFPVEADYAKHFDAIKADFEAKNPNITIQREDLTWTEGSQKFDTAINAGNPPDVMFIAPSAKYISTGLEVPVDQYLDPSALADYDSSALAYMKVDGKLYGLPLYMKIQTMGGNPQLMEKAGIDWKAIQKNGWTWDQFLELAKKGSGTNVDGKPQYGLVFNASGVDFSELLDHMLLNNGLPALNKGLDANGNYVWTDPKFLETLKFIRSLLDQGISPKVVNQVTAADKVNYFYSAQAMMIFKAIPYYEATTAANNKKVDAKTAPAGQHDVNFVLLPEPHAAGQPATSFGGVDGYSMYKQKSYTGAVSQDQHLKNVAKVMVALTSGAAGQSAVTLDLPQVTKTGDAMFKDKYNMNADNKAEMDTLFKNIAAPVQVDPDKSLKALKIYDEVIKPDYQALLGGDKTPEQMYQDVQNKAKELFGQ